MLGRFGILSLILGWFHANSRIMVVADKTSTQNIRVVFE